MKAKMAYLRFAIRDKDWNWRLLHTEYMNKLVRTECASGFKVILLALYVFFPDAF